MVHAHRDVYFDTVKNLERRSVALQTFLKYVQTPRPRDEWLRDALTEVTQWVGAEAGAVFVPDGDRLVVAVAHWAALESPARVEKENALKAVRLGQNEGIVGQVFQSHEPVTVPDVSKNAAFRGDMAQAAAFEVKNLLAIPLLVDDTVVGVLELLNKSPRGVFSSDDMEFALAVGAVLALALKSERPAPASPAAGPAVDPKELAAARLEAAEARAQVAELSKRPVAAPNESQNKRVQELTAEIERLNTVVEAATPAHQVTRLLKSIEPFAFTLSLPTVLKHFQELALRLVNAQAIQIFLWEGRTERLFLASTSTPPLGKGLALSFRKGEGVAGAAAESLEIQRVSDVVKEDRFSKTIDEAPGILARSLLAAPLAAQGKLVGVIEAINKKNGGEFGEEDVVAFGGLALVGAEAIEKTLLHRDTVALHRAVVGRLADLIESRDVAELGRHERVRGLAVVVSEALGLKEKEIQDLEWATLLFNIGLSTLPASLTVKRGDLTPAERDALGAVGAASADVLADFMPLSGASLMVRHCRERWDGLGAPGKLMGDKIPYGSRVLSVVDAFDAIVMGAGGRKPLPPEVAIKELEGASGKLFDPACVDTLARLQKAGRFKSISPKYQ